MLTIRQTQMQVLAAAREARFEHELRAHAWSFAPRLCRVAGAQGVAELVHRTIAGSNQYGWAHRELARFYLELALVLGAGFAVDPQYPWLGELLQDRICSPQMRAQLIHHKVMQYFEEALGPQSDFTIQAINKATVEISRGGWATLPARTADLIAWVEAIYPQKLRVLGLRGLATLREMADNAIQCTDVAHERGAAVLLGAMLLFGAGVIDDPMYPWLNMTLRDQRIINPNARLDRLERKLLRYILAAGTYLAAESGLP